MFLLVKLHIDMGLEAVLPGPQNALYVMLSVIMLWKLGRFNSTISCDIDRQLRIFASFKMFHTTEFCL